MNGTTHTPGPWEIQEVLGKIGIWKDGILVALVEHRPNPHRREEQANACLIAEVPMLLEALRGLTRAVIRLDTGESPHGSVMRDAMERARAAIAAAESEV